MDVHGFHIVSEPVDDPQSDGFATTVTKRDGTVRGPFKTVADAIRAAHAWHKEDVDSARAALKALEDSTNASGNQAQ